MSLTGFKHRADADVPLWGKDLMNLYWYVRVQGRDEAKRRRYYRYIKKERLRLVEDGICPHQIDALCKYLVSLKEVNARRLDLVLQSPPLQLNLPF